MGAQVRRKLCAGSENEAGADRWERERGAGGVCVREWGGGGESKDVSNGICGFVLGDPSRNQPLLLANRCR